MEILYKHAKYLVADKNTNNPVLEGIYFNGESAIMSNNHLLFILKDCPSQKRIAELKTGREIQGEYPDFGKVTPKVYLAELSFAPYLKDWIRIIKIGAEIAKANGVYLCLRETDFAIYARNAEDRISMQAALQFNESTRASVGVAVDAKYLLNILNVFKDLKDKDLKLKFAKNIIAIESESAFALLMGLSKKYTEARYGDVTA